MHSLPIFVRLSGRPVIVIGDGEAADAKRRLLERAGAIIADDGNADARLAIVALDSDSEAHSAAARLKARGVMVNAVDRPALCDFTLPAIVDRDPVLIAIGTGGASAGLAKALRQRLEALLPAGLGALASALAGARDAMKARWPGAADRRRAIDVALSEGGMLDPLADGGDVARWLAAPHADEDMSNRLQTIRLLSADPDELTLRAARLLSRADAIWYAPGVPGAVIARGRADAARIASDHPPQTPGDGLTLWIEAPPQ